MAHPRTILARFGLRPKKRYGQNFLVDEAAATRIAELCAREAPEGTRFLEIGAGMGALTTALLRDRLDLTAIEIDPDLVAVMRTLPGFENVRVVQADALTFDYADWAMGRPWRVTGNLPYNVATPLIVRCAEMDAGPQAMTVMVQQEVAERLAARPGTAAYGSLTVCVSYAMHVRPAFTLPPRAFFPPPKVRSTVVQLERRDAPAVVPLDLALFRKVVRGAFAYRRKTLANSLVLALGIDRAIVARALEAGGIAAEERGERLGIHDFARVADALAQA